MKKFFLITLAIALLITGCSSQNASNQTPDTPQPPNPSVNNKTDFFYPDDLNKGAKISDKFTVEFFESGELGSDSVSYKLSCDDFVKGDLNYIDGEYFVKFHEDIADKNVIVKNKNNSSKETEISFNIPIYKVDAAELLIPPEFFIYLKNGGEIIGDLYVNEINHENTTTSKSIKALVTEIKLDDATVKQIYAKASEYIEPMNSDLSNFDNETLFNKDEEFFIDYSDKDLVVIPAQDSINESKVETQEFEITDTGNEFEYHFYVFGWLDDIEFTYYENPLDERIAPVTINPNCSIENKKVILKAYLPTDFSYIGVKGLWHYQVKEGNQIVVKEEVIEFSLDDARDPSSHPIFVKKP